MGFYFMHMSRVLASLLVGYFVLHVVIVALLGSLVSGAIGESVMKAQREQMHTLALAVGQQIGALPGGATDASLLEHFESLGRETGFRLTLIRADGTVHVDSHKGTEEIGPHGYGTEITEARRVGSGFAERYSSTLGIPTMYFALRIPTDVKSGTGEAYVRVACSSASILTLIRTYQFRWWRLLLLLSLVGSVLMIVCTSWILQPFHEFLQAIKRLSAGEFNSLPNLIERRDEWGTLAESFRFMQAALTKGEMNALITTEKMETVLASMKEGVIAVDGHDQILIANPAVNLILNLDGIKLIERNLFDFVRVPELSRAIDQARLHQVFSQVEFESSHLSRRKVSARVTPMLGTSVRPPVASDSETQPGAVIVLSDVTEMRQLESMRQDFVANVSHELKTPLASIMAYAETLRLGALFDEEKNMEFVTQIEVQADLLHRQIQDLLQLARVESGEQNWNIQTVTLNQACDVAVEQFQSQATARGISLTVQLDARNPLVQADRDAIRTVLNNLVSNAIRYTPHGGQIRLETTQADQYAVLKVVDTGIGIAPEHHARIFERFYRVDRARARELGGTGLGLAIVKYYVQGFGGRVELTSQVDQGSTFAIWLPLR